MGSTGEHAEGPAQHDRRRAAVVAGGIVLAVVAVALVVVLWGSSGSDAAAPEAPSTGGISWGEGSGTLVPHDRSLSFEVTGLPPDAVAGRITFRHTGAAEGDGDDAGPAVEFEKQEGPTSAPVTVPAGSLEPGGSFEWRAMAWYPGSPGAPSPWSAWSSFSTASDEDRPSAATPLTPEGEIGRDDVLLVADGSWAPSPVSGAEVTDYLWEVSTGDPAEVVWEGNSDAPPQGPAQRAQVAVPDGVLEGGVEYRWRLRVLDAAGFRSGWSPQREVRTLSRASMDEEYWFIDHRAGSYTAGADRGEEASGLVASKQYPGVYWFIRDGAPDEDRAMLYAIRIDPETGLLANLGGVLTREIPVTAEANPDGGPDGVDNVDWEAITVDDAGNLHVGDIGDYWDGSSRSRNSDPNVADTRVYRIPEPDPYTATSATVAAVSEFTYPDGEDVNAEALFWHDGSLFLITKEGGGVARLFRLDLGSGRAVPLGVVDAVLDPVTGADVSDDGRNLAMATDSLRLVVLGTTGDPSPGVQGVVDLATAPDLRSHHYYRSAAALEADGQLERRREDPRFGRPTRRQPAGSEAYSRTAMQVEGVAFEHGGSGLGLIAEYGRHVVFVPLDVWSLRTGDGRAGG